MNMRFLLVFIIISTVFMVTSCAGNSGGGETEITEILRINPDCEPDNSTMEQCCVQDCQDFCDENNLPMSKNERNGKSCACWCG
jgi:hypothetical protein